MHVTGAIHLAPNSEISWTCRHTRGAIVRFSFGVRGKVLSLFGICALLFLCGGALGFSQLMATLLIYSGDVLPSQQNAVAIAATEADFKKQVQEWKDLLLRGKQPEALEKYWTNFQQHETDVQKAVESLSARVADRDAAQLLARFLAAHKSMGDDYRRGLQAFKDNGLDSTFGDRAVSGIDRAPTELLTKAKERLLFLASSRASEAAETTNRAIWRSVGLFIVVLLASVGLFFFTVRRSITFPLAQLDAALGAMAAGNVGIAVPNLDRHDEIGQIARTVGVIRENAAREAADKQEQAARAEAERAAQRKADMHRLAGEFEAAVGEIVETVSSASTELEASASTLTLTAQHSQNLATTVASASQEASTNFQSVASATEELSASVHEISRQVQSSARMASTAVDQTKTTTVKVSQLSKAAASIGDVVDLINTIAGQTNLLALNATIEAARAGEAGRGFAVVASEVKALAEQTAKATGEIGQQVSTIQAATEESVQAIKEISATIEQLSEVSSTIAAAVEEQGAATEEISRNIQQASQGTQLVSSNITDVQRGASETGSASALVLSAAQSLSIESNRLRQQVDRFLANVRAA